MIDRLKLCDRMVEIMSAQLGKSNCFEIEFRSLPRSRQSRWFVEMRVDQVNLSITLNQSHHRRNSLLQRREILYTGGEYDHVEYFIFCNQILNGGNSEL